MKTLIVEDDFISRKSMLKFLTKFGECDVTVDGNEAIDAFKMALDEGEAYDLICLDIKMPEKDGYQVLREIRAIEDERDMPEEERPKVIMTTTTELTEARKISKAFELGCAAYAGIPINQKKFEDQLRKLELI